mmetsp:Transcript_586/g.1762  ORF Transcript_586/g.1762 Transcript_586/m.1762 type:complete len:227 (+) Transcript_586:600-1280(+)
MHSVVETHNVVTKRGSPGRHHDLDRQVLSNLFEDRARLKCKLARGEEHKRLRIVLRRVHLFEARDDEGGGLARAVLGARQQVAAGERNRDGLLLDGGGLFEAFLENTHEQFAFQKVVLKVVPLGLGDVLRLKAGILGRALDALAPVVCMCLKRVLVGLLLLLLLLFLVLLLLRWRCGLAIREGPRRAPRRRLAHCRLLLLLLLLLLHGVRRLRRILSVAVRVMGEG